MAVIRLLPDGRRDSRFGRNGIWRTARICSRPALAVSNDGSVVVAGADDESFSFHDTATVVERLTATGVRDRRFGDAGDVRFSYPGRSETGAVDVLTDDRGRITVAGYAATSAGYDGRVYFALARLDRSGSLDAEFGRGGKTLAKVGPNRMDIASGVAATADGRLIVVGASDDSMPRAVSAFIVARFTAGGDLDRSFAHDGRATVDFGADAAAVDAAVRPDGSLVVAGSLLATGLDPANPEQLGATAFALAQWATQP